MSSTHLEAVNSHQGRRQRSRDNRKAGKRHTTPGQGSEDPEWADSAWMWDTVGRRVRTRNTKPEAARLAALHGEAVEAARVEPEHQGVVPKAEKKMGTT